MLYAVPFSYPMHFNEHKTGFLRLSPSSAVDTSLHQVIVDQGSQGRAHPYAFPIGSFLILFPRKDGVRVYVSVCQTQVQLYFPAYDHFVLSSKISSYLGLSQLIGGQSMLDQYLCYPHTNGDIR